MIKFAGKYFGLYIILLLLTNLSFSQPRVQKIRQLTTKDGLLTPGVKSIYKDSFGFMWFAFSTGITRYDGYEVKHFDDFLPDSSAINSYKYCNTFYEDRKGNIWIGTLMNGLVKYDYCNDNFTYYNQDPSEPNCIGFNTVGCIAEGDSGALWLGSGNSGLIKFHPESGRSEEYNPGEKFDKKGVNTIVSILIDSRENFWVGTKNGIFIFKPDSGSFTPVYTNPEIPENQNIIKDIVEDVSGDLWFATDWGVFRYNPDSKNWKQYITSNPSKPDDFAGIHVTDIQEVIKGSIHQMWITTSSGLAVYDYDSGRLEHFKNVKDDPESPVSGQATDIFFDDQGLLWISTDGVNIIDPFQNPFYYQSIYSYPDSINEIEAWCISETRDSMLWVGSFEDGMYIYDKNLRFTGNYKPTKSKTFGSENIQNNRISLIYEDSTGRIWIGNGGEGLSIFDRNNKTFESVALSTPSGPQKVFYANKILEDSFGILWLATSKGLFWTKSPWEKNQLIIPVSNTLLAGSSVQDILEDSRHRLWFSTVNSGILCLPHNERERLNVRKYFHENYNRGLFPNRNAVDFYEDPSGNIWMRSETGLFKFDENSDTILSDTHFNNLHNNEIFVVTGDSSGNLWFITQDGLLKYNPADSSSHCLQKIGQSEGLYYDRIVYSEFCKSRTGNFFIGGKGPHSNGFCWFKPNNIQGHNRNTPEIVITDFKINNKSVIPVSSLTIKRRIKLYYNQNFFSFEFASLDYRNPQKNQHAYMLEGLDDDWILSGSRRFANYTGVPPGTYTFRVKGSNNDGYWNEKGISIPVIIKPPPWKTWWAYTIYIIVLLGIGYTWRIYDLKRQHLKHSLEIEKVEGEKLKELDQMKSRFFANISHEFRTPLTLILAPLDQLKEKISNRELKQDLTVIQRNARRLQQLINQLLSLSRLESGKMRLQVREENIVFLVRGYVHSFESLAKQKEIELNFSSDEEEIILYADRDKLEKILYNLLSNAFKFTENGGRIKVEIFTRILKEFNNPWVELIISDTGKGIPENKLVHIFDRFYQADDSYTKDQEGSGIGLALVKELVDLHHARISVQSTVGRGTRFILQFNTDKSIFKAEEINVDIQPDRHTFSDKEPIEQFTESLKKGKAIIQNSDKPTDTKPFLLIVEDNDDLRAYIRSQLGPDYRISEAEDGKQGYEKAVDKIPDLIISDVMMPVMDGYELCRKIKQDGRTSHIPVILLTAKAAMEDKLEGLETGADDFLTKPFDLQELEVRIRNLIKQRKKLQSFYVNHIYAGDDRPLFEISDEMISANDKKFLKKAVETVEKYISDEDFTTEIFSHEMAISRVQLHRKLNALTGKSATAFVRMVRLYHAAQLLRKGTANVTQAAYESGFSNLSWFAKCFQEQFGKNPSELTSRHL